MRVNSRCSPSSIRFDRLDHCVPTGSSAAVIIWQFSSLDEAREQRSLRLIAISFFTLAVYVTAQAGFDLVAGDEPKFSAIGLALAVASLAALIIAALAVREGIDTWQGVGCCDSPALADTMNP